MTRIKTSRKLLFGKTILIAASVTLIVTILIVYLTGLASHRTIIENSFISLTILSLSLLSFLTFGLYNGFSIYDDLSHKLRFKWKKKAIPDGIDFPSELPDIPDFDDDLGGIFISIAMWILFTIGILLFLFLTEFIVSYAFIALVGIIYWIFIRALKLIFTKSKACEGDLHKSIYYAFSYTALYLGWIYGLIYLSVVIAV